MRLTIKLFYGLLVLVLSTSQQVIAAEDLNVYMIARSQITGTTYTQVVFFQSDEIKTLEECETERQYGLTSGWRIYTHLYNKKKGLGYSTHYRCVESTQQLSNWTGSRTKKRVVYLVSNEESKMNIRLMENYSKCMAEVRSVQQEESNQLFCGKSIQEIL